MNLSLRETSLRLGQNPQFMKTIENGSVTMKVKTLLNFCDFYLGENYNKEDKNVLKLYNNLTAENKELVLQLMKKLK